MNLSFDKVNKIITVLAPDTDIKVQELHNLIREFEDDLVNTNIKAIVSSSGKEPLGDNNYVGITLVLINGWRLAFEGRPGPETVQCRLSGGNFVGDIYPTPYTQPVIERSSSPTMTGCSGEDIADAVWSKELGTYLPRSSGDTLYRAAMQKQTNNMIIANS